MGGTSSLTHLTSNVVNEKKLQSHHHNRCVRVFSKMVSQHGGTMLQRVEESLEAVWMCRYNFEPRESQRTLRHKDKVAGGH